MYPSLFELALELKRRDKVGLIPTVGFEFTDENAAIKAFDRLKDAGFNVVLRTISVPDDAKSTLYFVQVADVRRAS